MALDELRAYVTDKVETYMGLNYPLIPTAYENQSFSTPTSGAFVYTAVEEHDGRAASFGSTNKFSRNFDIIMIEVWVPENTGTKTANDMALALSRQFQEQSYCLASGDYVSFGTARIVTLGTHQGRFGKQVLINVKRTLRWI